MTVSHLFKFCDPNDDRPFVQRPNLVEGMSGMVATNGHLCVVDTSVKYLGETAIKNKAILGLEKSFLQHSEITIEYQVSTFNPAPKDLYGGKCTRCRGKGKHGELIGCGDCDGQGEFEYGSHEYTCKECQGTGEIESDLKDVTCEECGGSGQKKDTLTQVGDSMIQSKYYRKIRTLPEVVFYKPEGESHTIYFSWAHGWGAVMPVLKP